jgi:ABC-2 type transport system ATP-binding protein
MKGELLLVECEPLGPAVEALRSAPDVIDAAVFGNALHLVVGSAETAILAITEFLRKREINVIDVEKIQPSLEDVFVSLTSEHDPSRNLAVQA